MFQLWLSLNPSNSFPETNGDEHRTGAQCSSPALLCAVVAKWAGVPFIEKNEFVRFHALQSVLTFGCLTIIGIVLGWIPFIGGGLAIIVWLFAVALWIILMIKAYQGERFKLPVTGDWTERQLSK